MVFGIIVKSGAVFKIRIFHAELIRLCVHELHKALLASGNMLGKGRAGVVGAADCGCAQKLVNRHCFALLEPDLRSAFSGCCGACGYFVLKRKLSAVNPFYYEKQRHDFCD